MKRHITGEYIEKELFDRVKESQLYQNTNGEVYFYGTRPHGSRKEDIVIKFITGQDYQKATGTAQIFVYVPNINIGQPRLVKDVARCRELSELASKFVYSLSADKSDFKYGLLQSIDTKEDEEAAQHFIRVRLTYEILND